MSKAYTEADFSDQITSDRAWRLKEISDLKEAVIKADPPLQRVLLRALVAICYAHWEGYVKYAATKYLQFVALRKFQYRELDRQFVRNHFLPRLASLSTIKTSIFQRSQLIDEILNSSEMRFAKVNEDIVSTKSNLNFRVFSDICFVCSVSTNAFVEKETFVDVLLLKRRNEIAHGKETFLDLGDLDKVTQETIALMRAFGDALENHVYLKDYRAR
jgi:HEPN superfamily RiboL-PSP-like protein